MGYPGRQFPQVVLVALLVAMGTRGCTSGKETAKENEEYIRDLHRYEAQFNPADYSILHPRTTVPPTPQSGDEHRPDSVHALPQETAELVSGFRVQLLSTKDIDAANQRKAEVESTFPGEWFYLVYDPPTYKLRAGNFQTRVEAERFAKQLVGKGYPDAWSVPDKVIKNPPLRSSSLPHDPNNHQK